MSDTTPVVRLIARTENARQALGMVAELVIERFPCNVGRESRSEAAQSRSIVATGPIRRSMICI